MIIGAVEYAHDPDETGVPQWCRIRPLFKSENFRWIQIEDAASEFPSQGLVYWYGSPAEAVEGTYWMGHTHQNPGGGEGNRPDLYGLEEGQRAYEFVDLRGHADPTDLRRLCAAGNLSFSHRPIGPILVKISGVDSEWVGPLELGYTQDESGRYIGSHEGLSGFVSVHEVNADLIQELMIDGARVRVLRPKSTIGGKVRWFNAQDDNSLLQSALRRIRKVDRDTAEAMGITRSVFEAYVETLRGADLLGDLALKEGAREEALRQLIERVGSDFLARQEVAEALLSQETVQDQLNGLIARRVDEQGAEIAAQAAVKQSELLKVIEEVESRLGSLRAEEEDKANQISSQNKLINSQEKELDKLAKDLSRRLQKAVSKVISHPVDELGRHAVIQALVNAGTQKASRKGSTVSLTANGELLTKLPDLCGALIVGSKKLSVRDDPLLTMAASLLSGRLPICVGSRAQACAQFLGSLIAGNNLFEIIVPSNVYSVDDLLCLPAYNPNTEGASRLFEILEQAESTPKLVVLILSGVNRAPLEAAFENLIPDEHVSRSVVAVPFRDAGAHQVPQIVRITKNVLIIGSLTSGPSTFLIPTNLRQRISVVDTDYPIDLEIDDGVKMPSGFRVSTDSWRDWADSARAVALPLLEMNLPDSADRFASDVCTEEIKVFHAVYGESESERAIAAWIIARLAGAVDDSELRLIGESCGQAVAQVIIEAIENGQVRRIDNLIQPTEI